MQTAGYSELEERQTSEDMAVGCMANIPATLRNTIASNTLSRFVNWPWFGEMYTDTSEPTRRSLSGRSGGSRNFKIIINPLTPNDDYSGRTAPLTSKRCILYIYSTNTGSEYFKHGIYSPFFPLQNAVCFINVTYLVPVLFTFYIQDVLKLKK